MAANVPIGGILAPSDRAMPVLRTPAQSPFSIAICTGSAPDTRRVRLLSAAQATHAPIIASIPHGGPIAGRPAQESVTAPAVINANPKAMRRSKFSLKTNHASNAVKTASKFRSRDAAEAVTWANPLMSKRGATTPPHRIAPVSHGASTPLRAGSACVLNLRWRSALQTARPRPDAK